MTRLHFFSTRCLLVFVGIDVAKDKLDLARSDTDRVAHLRQRRRPASRRIVELLAAAATASCIVVESTGGLERALLAALLDADLPVALVNPGRVRHFAIGIGILAKTDPIDARVLMQFARWPSARLAQKRSENQAELDALITCRRQLHRGRTEQSNCRGTTAARRRSKSIDAVLKTLDKQIDSLDQQIRKLIDSDDDFKHLDRLLQSVPGVGPVLSSTLVAELQRTGHAPTAGRSAPWSASRRSTTTPDAFHGKRAIRGGRAQVRSVLYMATLAAIRFNPRDRTLRRTTAARPAKPPRSSSSPACESC